jgi:hypothetical protein
LTRRYGMRQLGRPPGGTGGTELPLHTPIVPYRSRHVCKTRHWDAFDRCGQ